MKRVDLLNQDGSVHQIEPNSLVSFDINGFQYFILDYYDINLRTNLVALLERDNNGLKRIPFINDGGINELRTKIYKGQIKTRSVDMAIFDYANYISCGTVINSISELGKDEILEKKKIVLYTDDTGDISLDSNNYYKIFGIKSNEAYSKLSNGQVMYLMDNYEVVWDTIVKNKNEFIDDVVSDNDSDNKTYYVAINVNGEGNRLRYSVDSLADGVSIYEVCGNFSFKKSEFIHEKVFSYLCKCLKEDKVYVNMLNSLDIDCSKGIIHYEFIGKNINDYDIIRVDAMSVGNNPKFSLEAALMGFTDSKACDLNNNMIYLREKNNKKSR